MFLDKLTIHASGSVIREVHFKKGINLILDESVSDNPTESGNSVGKTTSLRMVDFCFGSDGDDIYKDEESGQVNPEVSNFLKSKNVTAILEVVLSESRMILTRSFGNPEIFKINDTEYSNLSDYKKALEIQIFDIIDSQPTLRQLIPKFIRSTPESMSKAVKYLHAATSNNDYELIYGYLFGFEKPEVISERYGLKKQIKKLKDRITALKNGKTVPALKQAVAVINKELDELRKKKEAYDIDGIYDDKLAELSEIKRDNAYLSGRIASVETEIQMHKETLEELKHSASEVDPRAVKELYKEASNYIENLNKDFEDVLNFHNNLVNNKVRFVEKSLSEKDSQLKDLNKKLSKNLKQETTLLQFMSSKGALDDVEGLYEEIVKKSEEKGRREQLINEIEEAESERTDLEKKLGNLQDEFLSALVEFEENVKAFNVYFSDYAKKLYDENFIFTYDDSGDTLKVFIDNIDGNVGSGKKKATIAAFDFAFISYFSDKNSNLPHFVLHDGIEDIADNQIKTLFDIASKLDGQYIVSLIKDRIAPVFEEKFIKENTILSLNEGNKLLKF